MMGIPLSPKKCPVRDIVFFGEKRSPCGLRVEDSKGLACKPDRGPQDVGESRSRSEKAVFLRIKVQQGQDAGTGDREWSRVEKSRLAATIFTALSSLKSTFWIMWSAIHLHSVRPKVRRVFFRHEELVQPTLVQRRRCAHFYNHDRVRQRVL